MRRIRKALMGAMAAAMAAHFLSGVAFAQADTSVLIRMTEIRITKEDDPLSNDEPYLINIGFKARVSVGDDAVPSLVPDTLSVVPIGKAAHHNLGRGRDNWANRGGTYPFDTQLFGVVIPNNEPGWIVGVVSLLMEEDAYSDSAAMDLRKKVQAAVVEAIGSLKFDSVDSGGITHAVASRIVRDVQKAGSRLNIAGLIRGIASAVDPDDFGGVNMVLAITMPMNGLMMFAGAPPENIGAVPTLTNVPAGGQAPFTLEFPGQVPGGILWNARYRGRCKVNGVVIRGG